MIQLEEDRGCPPLISGFSFASPSASTPAKGGAEAQTERVMAISAVTDVTGCEPDVARLLLEASEWQVEAAVAQFLDNNMGEDVKEGNGKVPIAKEPLGSLEMGAVEALSMPPKTAPAPELTIDALAATREAAPLHIGDAVTWTHEGAGNLGIRGLCGKVVRFSKDGDVEVQFEKGLWSFKINQLRSLQIGDAVTWTHKDAGNLGIRGLFGKVVKFCKDGDVVVQFEKGEWSFKISQLNLQL